MTSNQLHQPAAEIPAGTFWTQAHGGECRWIERTRDDLLAILQSDNAPEFRTVLGATAITEDGKPAKASGPFYVDFDGPLDETISAVHRFIGLLQGTGLNMDMVRAFASGGRGFHLEIPEQCFMPKVPAGGTPELHLTYRRMAQALAVDTLDHTIYSIRRMWRVPNVRRPNGLYKVPLTVSEIMTLTPDRYTELCSTPRPFPDLVPASFVPKLGILFSESTRQVRVAQVTRTHNDKVGADMIARFHPHGAMLPPSLLALAAGLIPPREGTGWNRIAMQLGITARAMGVTEGQLVDLARPLIENHRGDGRKYDTARKRERELRDQWRNADDPKWKVSVGGIRDILPVDLPCNDLKGF